MVDWITNSFFWLTTGWIGLFLYWLPVFADTGAYFVKFVRTYHGDIKRRESAGYYEPKLTIGYIVGHMLLAWTPVLNIWALIFDVLADYFELFAKFLEIPLVPKRKETKQ